MTDTDEETAEDVAMAFSDPRSQAAFVAWELFPDWWDHRDMIGDAWQAVRWRDAGFDPVPAGTWVHAGFTPDEARRWTTEFTGAISALYPAGVRTWIDLVGEDHVGEWVTLGLSLVEAALWTREGPVTAAEARYFCDHDADTNWYVACRQSGWTAAQIIAYHQDHGTFPDPAQG